jgi:hypothetical protein
MTPVVRRALRITHSRHGHCRDDWVGRLEAAGLVEDSYRMIAPRKLVRLL